MVSIFFRFGGTGADDVMVVGLGAQKDIFVRKATVTATSVGGTSTSASGFVTPTVVRPPGIPPDPGAGMRSGSRPSFPAHSCLLSWVCVLAFGVWFWCKIADPFLLSVY